MAQETGKSILVFDFDGTLADTFEHFVAIGNRMAEKHGFRRVEPDEIGVLRDMTFWEAVRYFDVPLMKVPFFVAQAERELRRRMGEVKVAEGIRETVFELKSSGLTMGIVTSNSLQNVMAFLRRYDMEAFDFVKTLSRIWGKVRQFRHVMRDYGLTPGQILYVCDEVRDIRAARKAGVRVAAVSWGFNSAKVLKESQPDYLLSDPKELLSICKNEWGPGRWHVRRSKGDRT
ncbi:MAG: HAD hydrolase-like protein [Planctomycetes bacterium]|nr:HAD hydrolase-like protein [Planctomycetota bacterium]